MITLLIRLLARIAAVFGIGRSGGRSADDAMAGLRTMILSTAPEATPDDPRPVAVIMDQHLGGAVASVMSSTGGDASIYLSSGGGWLGGIELPTVRVAAVAFANEVFSRAAEMTTTDEFPYPSARNVRFYLRTTDGTFFAEVPEAQVTAGTHPFSPAFAAAQQVITAFREASGQ